MPEIVQVSAQTKTTLVDFLPEQQHQKREKMIHERNVITSKIQNKIWGRDKNT